MSSCIVLFARIHLAWFYAYTTVIVHIVAPDTLPATTTRNNFCSFVVYYIMERPILSLPLMMPSNQLSYLPYLHALSALN